MLYSPHTFFTISLLCILLQDIPLHVAMISHILIAWDRMRWLNDPLKGRIPGFVCCCATWLTGMVIALPYPIYTIYVELGVSIRPVYVCVRSSLAVCCYIKNYATCAVPPLPSILVLPLSPCCCTCPDQREVIRPLKHSAAPLDARNCRADCHILSTAFPSLMRIYEHMSWLSSPALGICISRSI